MTRMHPMIMLAIVGNDGQAVHPPTPFSKRTELQALLNAYNTTNSQMEPVRPLRIAEVDITERKTQVHLCL